MYMDKIKINTLTGKEKETLTLIMQGYQNKEIAKILCITIHTVKAHIASIYTKLGVHNKVQAVVIAIKHKIVDIYDI